jgi:hypothetical protein
MLSRILGQRSRRFTFFRVRVVSAFPLVLVRRIGWFSQRGCVLCMRMLRLGFIMHMFGISRVLSTSAAEA